MRTAGDGVPSMAEDLGIGERLGRIRRRRGITQDELAERSGVNVSSIRKLEQGGRATASLETLNKLARALAVTTSDLFRPVPRFDTVPAQDSVRDDLLILRQVLTGPRSIPGITFDHNDEFPSVSELRSSLNVATDMFHRDQYVEVARAIPLLLTEARLAAEELSGEEGEAALAVLAQAYQVAGSVLTHLRKEDLALHALDLSLDAAEARGDAILSASAVVAECWVFIRQGRFREAQELAFATAEAIEPSFSKSSRVHISTWGWLLLRAAAAAVRDAKADEAEEAMRQARAGAELIGRDRIEYHEYWSTFGPSTVAMKAVEVAVIGGKPDRALVLANEVPPGGRPTSNNRNRFLLDKANAYAEQRKYGEALTEVLNIMATSPDWLKYQHYAQRITRKIMSGRKRGLTPELRGLADFLSVDVLA